MLETPSWSTFHAARASRHRVVQCRTRQGSTNASMKHAILMKLAKYAEQLRDHPLLCLQARKNDAWDKASGCPAEAHWLLTMARSRSLSLIIFRISSTKEASYQEPQADKSFKLIYLVHSFADGPCRILFYEMGMRRWAVEPRHMEPSEKADKDRRPTQGIWLAASLFKAFARQETLRHASKNLALTLASIDSVYYPMSKNIIGY